MNTDEEREAQIERDMPYKGWLTGRGETPGWGCLACILSTAAMICLTIATLKYFGIL